jgi:hypothetical protein
VYLGIEGEDVAVSVHDSPLGSVFLCPLFEENLVIIGEVIVGGAFGVIAVNTMKMVLLDAISSVHAGTKVSAFMCAVLTHVYCLRWWGGIFLVDARR